MFRAFNRSITLRDLEVEDFDEVFGLVSERKTRTSSRAVQELGPEGLLGLVQ